MKMKISKLIPDLKVAQSESYGELAGHKGGKLTALIVRAIGQALCQPDELVFVDFGHPLRPVQMVKKVQETLDCTFILHVKVGVSNNQVVLLYSPWREEYRSDKFRANAPRGICWHTSTLEDYATNRAVRGEPWLKLGVDLLAAEKMRTQSVVMFDEMDKYPFVDVIDTSALGKSETHPSDPLTLQCNTNPNDIIDVQNDDCSGLLHIAIGEFDSGVHKEEVMLTKENENALRQYLNHRAGEPIRKLAQQLMIDNTTGDGVDLSYPSEPLVLPCTLTPKDVVEFSIHDNGEQLCIEIALDDNDEPAYASAVISVDSEVKLRNYLGRRAGVDVEITGTLEHTNEAAVAIIKYVLNCDDEPMTALQLWSEGDFQALRDEWKDVPESVFIGADPLHVVTGVDQSADRLQCELFEKALATPIAIRAGLHEPNVIVDLMLNPGTLSTGQTTEEDDYNG